MNLPKYNLKSNEDFVTFEFISEEIKGKIVKIIQFTPTNHDGVCNLAFGDRDENSVEIDDLSISNNGDSDKVLATVVSAVLTFSEKRKGIWIYTTGSTSSRTRLYQIGISKYLKEIELYFEIYGLLNGDWKMFKKGAEYEGFLVRRKKCKFE